MWFIIALLKAWMSRVCIIPVMWTCGRCLVAPSGLRTTRSLGRHDEAACWPSVRAPCQWPVSVRMCLLWDSEKHKMTPYSVSSTWELSVRLFTCVRGGGEGCGRSSVLSGAGSAWGCWDPSSCRIPAVPHPLVSLSPITFRLLCCTVGALRKEKCNNETPKQIVLLDAHRRFDNWFKYSST